MITESWNQPIFSFQVTENIGSVRPNRTVLLASDSVLIELSKMYSFYLYLEYVLIRWLFIRMTLIFSTVLLHVEVTAANLVPCCAYYWYERQFSVGSHESRAVLRVVVRVAQGGLEPTFNAPFIETCASLKGSCKRTRWVLSTRF